MTGYIMITFPYRLALHFHRAEDTAADPWPHLPGVERAIDAFFIADVLLNFRTTYARRDFLQSNFLDWTSCFSQR